MSFGQHLTTNKIDEFTKSAIKETSYESLTSLTFNSSVLSYFKFVKVDSILYLKLLFATGTKVFSVRKDGEMMLKLSNDSILIFDNLKYTISCEGCGSKGITGSVYEGVELSFVVNNSQYNQLKNYKVAKLRIYTTNGYVESEVKDKHSETILKAISLI